jgi:solute carrier family 35 protein
MTLTFLQGMVTLVCLDLMKRRKLIDYPNFDWGVARKVAPLSFVFIAYVVISLVSLGRVNVPMFTALRRLTIVFVMIEEFYMLGILPSSRVMHSVIIMCIGAAIAAYRDLTFDLVRDATEFNMDISKLHALQTSYTFLFLTNLFTSLYTVYINVIKKETNLNVFAMMYYNNVTTMPALLFLAYITGDLGRAWEFPLWVSA